MKVSDVEICSGDLDRPYKIIGRIEAKIHATTVFSREPRYEEVNAKLREIALEKGANAVINVKYKRSLFGAWGSWKGLKAEGTAVLAEPMRKEKVLEEDPLKILKLRLARGEITKEEYEEMKKALEE